MRNLPTAHLIELKEALREKKVTQGIDKDFRAKQKVALELKLREDLAQYGIRKN